MWPFNKKKKEVKKVEKPSFTGYPSGAIPPRYQEPTRDNTMELLMYGAIIHSAMNQESSEQSNSHNHHDYGSSHDSSSSSYDSGSNDTSSSYDSGSSSYDSGSSSYDSSSYDSGSY
jgi:hypothetical protein